MDNNLRPIGIKTLRRLIKRCNFLNSINFFPQKYIYKTHTNSKNSNAIKCPCYCCFPVFCPMLLVFSFSSNFYVLFLLFPVFFVCIDPLCVTFSRCYLPPQCISAFFVTSPCLLAFSFCHSLVQLYSLLSYPQCAYLQVNNYLSFYTKSILSLSSNTEPTVPTLVDYNWLIRQHYAMFITVIYSC